jgi:FkbM family methyltransferase
MDSRKLNIAGLVEIELFAGDRICAHVDRDGSFEPQSLTLWAELCAGRPGSTVIDVGSYTGLYSIAAAKLGCKPVAFEPIAEIRSRMTANLALNGVEVQVIKAAASSAEGTRNISINKAIPLSSGATIGRVRRGFANVPIQTKTIDSMRWNDLLAVKIDAEHHELEVIIGAILTLSRFRPWMIVEVLTPLETAAVIEMLRFTHAVHDVYDRRNLILKPQPYEESA